MPKKSLPDIITSIPEALDIFADEAEMLWDLETSGLHYQRDEVAVVSLHGVHTQRTAILHVQGMVPPSIIDFLSSPRLFIGHNIAAFDLLFMGKLGIDLDTPTWYDTMIGESIALTSARKDLRVSLQAAVHRRLGIDILKEAGGHTWMAHKLTPEQLTYCREDVVYLGRLRAAQLKTMGAEQLRALDLEHKLIPILIKMALRGIPLDYSKINQYEHDRRTQFSEAGDLIEMLLGDVNIASPAQLVKGVQKATGYQLAATTQAALQNMATEPGNIGKLAQALLLKKSNPARDSLGLEGQSFAGAIYPRYRQVNRDDGRLEVVEPDLTKVPSEGRALFGGIPEHSMVSVRYGNLWWGVMAYLSRDPQMMDLATSEHLPAALATKLWSEYENFSVDDRVKVLKCARALTIGALFGHPPAKLEQALRMVGLDPTTISAAALQARLVYTFPGLDKLHKQAENQARLPAAPITFPSGMRRVIAKAQPWEITSLRAKGTVGTLIKETVLGVAKNEYTEYLRGVMAEELLFLIPDSLCMNEDWGTGFRNQFPEIAKRVLGISLPVDIKMGSHWS